MRTSHIKVVYYAHCIALYNTPQEARDVATLEALGFTVINPNQPDVEARCLEIRAEVATYNEQAKGSESCLRDAGGEVMERVFKRLVTMYPNGLAFRALPDGRIPSGVLQEILWAREADIPVFELPSNMKGRKMSVDETRDYLHEVGQR